MVYDRYENIRDLILMGFFSQDADILFPGGKDRYRQLSDIELMREIAQHYLDVKEDRDKFVAWLQSLLQKPEAEISREFIAICSEANPEWGDLETDEPGPAAFVKFMLRAIKQAFPE